MLDIRDFALSFRRYNNGSLRRTSLKIIENLDLTVNAGEITAVIGSSGAGKSLLAHALLGILPSNAVSSGTIIYKGDPLTDERKKLLRGNDIVLIPQSVGFLNPLKTAGAQVMRAACLSSCNAGYAAELCDTAFKNYSLPAGTKNLYPHEISGGMARRVLTAMATVTGASLIIADEPTTGLDSITRDESLDILRALADEGKGVILITHDLNAAVRYADRIAVFYAGTTVESAPAENFRIPAMLNHPYSRALIDALPQNGFVFSGISKPELTIKDTGCRFHVNCSIKNDICRIKYPERTDYEKGFVRCNNASV